MTTVEEAHAVRDACAFLSAHAEYLVDRERNVVGTLLAWPGFMRARGFVAPSTPPTPPSPAPSSQPPTGPSVAQMLAETEPAAVYARRAADVRRAQRKGAPEAGTDPAPAADDLDPARVYEHRRVAVRRAQGRG